MLRIKEGIDLKELEKYGFDNNDDEFYEYDLKNNRTYITVDKITKEIGIPNSLYGDLPATYIDNLDVIYDLIKADMVERI